MKCRKISYGLLITACLMLLSGCKTGISPRVDFPLESLTEEASLVDSPAVSQKPTQEVEADVETGIVATTEADLTEPETSVSEETTAEETTTETEAPTEKPTQKPTQAQTQKPTQAPTQAPTQKPTQAPAPTQAPTQAQTQKPTQAVTQKQTQAATQKTTEATSIAAQTNSFDVGSNKDVYEKAVSMYDANLKRAEKMLERINAYRVENGLNELVLDQKLCYAAGMRAVEMDYGNYFEHRRYNGADNFTTIRYVGITYAACGEVLASGCENVAQTFNLWKNSSHHNAIILSSKYKKMGLGYCSKKGHMIWVVQFTD